MMLLCRKCNEYALYQSGKYESVYNRSSFKCGNCKTNTTLSPKGIEKRKNEN